MHSQYTKGDKVTMLWWVMKKKKGLSHEKPSLKMAETGTTLSV